MSGLRAHYDFNSGTLPEANEAGSSYSLSQDAQCSISYTGTSSVVDEGTTCKVSLTSGGSLTLSKTTQVEYLVVGGGGGGGGAYDNGAAGGGAGGEVKTGNVQLNSGTISVAIGGGGSGGTGQTGIASTQANETFGASGTITTTTSFLVNGTTALSTSNNGGWYLGTYPGYCTDGCVNVYSPSLPMKVEPASPATYVSLHLGAKNGTTTASVYYTDGSTTSFSLPDNCASNGCNSTVTFNATAGKYIDYIYLPAEWDYYLLDDVNFGGAQAAGETSGAAGAQTTFGTITARGGAGGSGSRNGGSSGAGGTGWNSGSTATGGTGGGSSISGGGGGGAGGPGQSSSGSTPGNGGLGLQVASLSSTYMGTGGNGGTRAVLQAGTAGVANTGQGGRGASAQSSSGSSGGSGGSGIVVFRYDALEPLSIVSASRQVSGLQQSGQPLQSSPTISIKDSLSNTVSEGPGSNATVSMEVLPNGVFGQFADLLVDDGNGNYVADSDDKITVTAVNGVATFSGVRIGGKVGTYTIRYSISSPSNLTADQSITITPGVAVKLGMIQEPEGRFDSGQKVGRVVSGSYVSHPSVAVVDSYGNTVTSDSTTSVTVSEPGNLGSVLFPTGSSYGAMTITNPGTDFNFGTGDFSIEWWMNADSLSGSRYYKRIFNAGNIQIAFELNNLGYIFTDNKRIRFSYQADTLNNWVHYSMVRKDGVLGLFRNGTVVQLDIETSTSGVYSPAANTVSLPGDLGPSSATIEIGRQTSYTHTVYDGELADMHFVKGRALRTPGVAFTTPRTSSYPVDGTVFLLKPDSTNVAVDVSGTGKALSISNVTYSSANPSTFSANILGGSTTSVTVTNGIATFNNILFNGAATDAYKLNFSASGLGTLGSDFFYLDHGVAAKLDITRQPTTVNVRSGQALTVQPQVTLRDEANNITTRDSQTFVTAALAPGSTGTLGGNTTVKVVNGVATFSNLTLTGTPTPSDANGAISSDVSSPNTYNLVFTTSRFQSQETSDLHLVHGAPAAVEITSHPTTFKAGLAQTSNTVVKVVDSNGHQITDWERLAIAAPKITASYTLDGEAVVTETFTGSNEVSVVRTGAGRGTATFTDLAIGAAAGSKTITYSYSGSADTVADDSQAITLIGGTPTKLVEVTTPPAEVSAGVAFTTNPVVKLQDAWNNDTLEAGSVTSQLLSPAPALIGSASAAISASAGAVTFSGLSYTATPDEGYKIRYALDGTAFTLDSTAFEIKADVPANLVFATNGDVGNSVSGLAIRSTNAGVVTVEVHDVNGYLVDWDNTTSITATVTSSPAGSTVTALSNATETVVNGVATFDLMRLTATSGTGYVLTFRATNAGEPVNADTVVSSSFQLLPGSASQISVVTPAAGARSGKNFTTMPTLQVRDAEGSLIDVGPDSGAEITVTVENIPGQTGALPTLSTTNVNRSATAGVANFAKVDSGDPLALRLTGVVGTYRLIYSMTNARGQVISTSQTIALQSGDPVGVRQVGTVPASIQLGKAISPAPVFELIDANGNRVVLDSTSEVTVSLVTSSGAAVAGTASTVATSNAGLVQFNNLSFGFNLSSAPHKLKAELTEIDGVTAQGTPASAFSNGFDLTHGDPSQFALADGTSPATTATGSDMTELKFAVFDAWGNPATDSTPASLTTTIAAVSGVAGDIASVLRSSASLPAGVGSLAALNVTAKPGTYSASFAASWNGSSLIWKNPALTSAQSAINFVITHAAPARIEVVTAASGARSGNVVTTQPRIKLVDRFGNLATSITGNISVTTPVVADSLPTLQQASPTAALASGEATFSGLTMTGVVGDYVLTYAFGGFTTTQVLSLEAGNPYRVTMKTQPTDSLAGELITTQPKLEVRDAQNNLVSWAGSDVTVTAATKAGQVGAQLLKQDRTPAATVDVQRTAVNGEVAFQSLRLKGQQDTDYNLVFSGVWDNAGTAVNLVGVESAPFRLGPGVFAQLSYITQPRGAANGTALQGVNLSGAQPVNTSSIQLQMKDAFGNLITNDSNTSVTASVVGGSSSGSVSGTVTAVSVNGVVTFNNLVFAGLTGAQGYTLQFASANVQSQESSTFEIEPGAPTNISIVRAASGASAGQLFSTLPRVKVTDFKGNTVTNQTGNLSVLVSGTGQPYFTGAGAGTITGEADVPVGIQGVLGTYSVTYRATFGSTTLSVTQDGVNLAAGSAYKLGIIENPIASGTQTGSAFTPQPELQLQDQWGNPVSGQVSISATLLPSTLTPETGDFEKAVLASEVATWPTTLSAQEDAFDDLSIPTMTTNSSGRLVFSDLAVIGAPGNSYKLRFTSNSLPEPNVESTSFTLGNAQADHFVFTDGAATPALTTGIPANFSVAAGSTLPAVNLELRDRFGNRVMTGVNGPDTTIRIRTSPNDATLGAGAVLTATGVLTKKLNDGRIGFSDLSLGGLVNTVYELEAVSPSIGIISPASSPIALTPAAPASLRVTSQPMGGDSGTAFAAGDVPAVEVVDSYGNRVLDYVGEAALTITPGVNAPNGGVITAGGTATFISGVATFTGLTVTGKVATDYQLNATSGNLPAVTTSNFRLDPGAAAELRVTTEPAGGVTRGLLSRQPQLRLYDAQGNQIFGSNLEVTVSLRNSVERLSNGNSAPLPAGAALGYCEEVSSSITCSNTLPVLTMDANGVINLPDLRPDVNNVVTEGVGYTMAGSTQYRYFLEFATSGLATELTASSAGFFVANGSSTTISLVQDVVASSGAVATASGSTLTIQPRLELLDADGNLAQTDSTTPVLVEISSGTSGQLLGKRVAVARNGIVEFTGLSFKGLVDTNYRLAFRTPLDDATELRNPAFEIQNTITPVQLQSAQTVEFTVTPGPIASISQVRDMTPISVSGAIAAVQPKLAAFDELGNPATAATTPVSVTLSGGASVLLRNGVVQQNNSATVAFSNGFAEFTGLAVQGVPGELYGLTFSVGGSVNNVSQQDLAVTTVPSLSIAYPNITFNDPDPAVTLTRQGNGVVSYAVHAGSSTICSVDSATGAIEVLGAGTCQVNATMAEDLLEVSVTRNGSTILVPAGGFSATTATTSFTIAKAPQAALVATGTGVTTVSTLVGNQQITSYLATLNFGQTLPLAVPGLTSAFSGGSTSAAITFPTEVGQCRVIGGRLIPGNVVISQGQPGVVCEITFTKAGDDNYLPVTNKLAVRVLPAPQAPLLVASPSTMTFGQTMRLFTGGGSGDGSVTYQIITGNENCELGTDSGGFTTIKALATASPACTIRALKAGSLNFLPTQSDNNLEVDGLQDQAITVARVAQTVAFTTVKPQFPIVDGDYTPAAAATSGLPTQITIIETLDEELQEPICVFEGGKVVFKLQGECLIRAEQAGNQNYLAATPIIQSIIVGGLNQTITFEKPADVNFGSSPFVLTAASNAGLPVTFARGNGGSSEACTVSPTGVVSIGSAGVCEVVASAAENQLYAAASDVIQRFSVLPIESEPPFITSVSVSDQSITVSYRDPGNTGGSSVKAYQAVLTPTDESVQPIVDSSCLPFMGPVVPDTQPTTTCRIDGLENGRDYSLTMAAITEFGVGRFTPATEVFAPIENYSAVTQLKAISDAETTTLIWGEPIAVEGSFQRYDVYVRLPGEQFPDEPVSTVTDYESIGASVQLSDLPIPYADEEQGDQVQVQSFSPRRFQVSSVAPAQDDPQLSPPSTPTNNDPMSQVPRYEFKVVTVSSVLQSAQVLNTAYITQQLVSVPSAPNTINAEPQGPDMLIGWTGSRFDGGSRIIDYVVTVNGEEVCVEQTPSACVFPEWEYSTTYEVAVAARNEIGLSRTTTTSLTTIDDPTPPATGNYQYPGPIFAKLEPARAATGQVVTVTGQRLNLVQRMLIGGKEVEYVIYGSEKLAFKVPFGLVDGRYDITVYSEYGELTVQDILTIAGAPLNEDLTDQPVEPEFPGTPEDQDGDGIPDNVDADIDGDGRPNGADQDIDGDNIPNVLDPDPVTPNDEDEALDKPRPTNGEQQDQEQDSEVQGSTSDTNGADGWIGILGTLMTLLVVAASGTFAIRQRRLKAKQD
jgi:hypothetical protein